MELKISDTSHCCRAMLSFGDSEHILNLTTPACSLNHLNINIILECSISTHCYIQAASLPRRGTLGGGDVRVLNANHQEYLSLL